MNVFVSQIYIQPGVDFRFRQKFQGFLSRRLTELVAPSPHFNKAYGEDFDLIFRMSARQELTQAEIKGPTVFRRDKNVEYSIFLPFDKSQPLSRAIVESAVFQFLQSIVTVLNDLEIDTAELQNRLAKIVADVMHDSAMLPAECVA